MEVREYTDLTVLVHGVDAQLLIPVASHVVRRLLRPTRRCDAVLLPATSTERAEGRDRVATQHLRLPAAVRALGDQGTSSAGRGRPGGLTRQGRGGPRSAGPHSPAPPPGPLPPAPRPGGPGWGRCPAPAPRAPFAPPAPRPMGALARAKRAVAVWPAATVTARVA